MKNLKKLILLGTIAVITFSFTSVVKTDWGVTG